MFDAASTKTLFWIILGSAGAVALALIVVVVLTTARTHAQTAAREPVPANSETTPPATVSQTAQPPPPTPPSPRQLPVVETRSNLVPPSPSPSQSPSAAKPPSQPQKQAVVVVIASPTTPTQSSRTQSQSQSPTPAIVVLDPKPRAPSHLSGTIREISIPDASFEDQKETSYRTFPGWTEVPPTTATTMYEIASSPLAGIHGKKYLRLYMNCGKDPTSPVWEFRSPKLGQFEADTRYHLTIAMSRSGGDDRRKATISLSAPKSTCASTTVTYMRLGEDSFSDLTLDFDARADSPNIGKDIHIVIRFEAHDATLGSSLNIDNLRLTAQHF